MSAQAPLSPHLEDKKMNVAELFVRCLENEGVRYVFGLPGEENEDLIFALENSSISFIPTRHEQGAAFMADIWGRVSGKAGVCLATLGPGATNLVTGVADANLDKSPVVAITGQAGLGRMHKESHQYLDVVGIFKPVTKWNAAISNPEVVPEIVRKAFKIAENEKPGATHIELSEDVAGSEASGSPLRVVPVRRPDPDRQALKETVQLLKKAKHPIVLAGNGTVRKPCSEQLTELVTAHNIPVVHTFMGNGAVSDKLSQSLFTIGFGFRDIVMDAMDKADLVLAIGYDIAEYAPSNWNLKKDKKIVHIDFTPAEVYAHYLPDVEIVADIPAILRELNQELRSEGFMTDSSWYAGIRERIRKDIDGYALQEGKPFTVPGVLHFLNGIMKCDDLLISDVGSHKLWVARNFSAACPNGRIISNGLASMGIALPGALAAAIHSPQRRIVAVMGDGGFLMNSQELETAKRVGAGFVNIVFNDNDYGLISWKQRMSHGRSTGTRLTNPDFKLYAESFGIKGYKPASVAELKEQLSSALEARELCVMEVPIDQSVNDELISKLKAGEKRNGID